MPAQALCLCQGSMAFGNEYRDAGCAESDIIWQVELREGKDHPQHLGNKENDDKGKTVGTLLCLT